MRHRLAEVVEERGTLRGLHARPELGRHDPREVDDLERVLEDVLAVARAEAEAPEDADELLAQLAAIGLEDSLRARLVDLLVELRLRRVVHLLDPGGMDPAVLDELFERELRHLTPDPVERGEDDRVRRVVDDEINAGQVLERADVPALAADDAALHVVARELDDGDRGLRRMACGDALQSVRNERAGPAARVGPCLLLHLAHGARELVANQVLRPLEHADFASPSVIPEVRSSSTSASSRAALSSSWSCLRCTPVTDPLLAAPDLEEPLVELGLPLRDPLLDLRDLDTPALHLAVDLRA